MHSTHAPHAGAASWPQRAVVAVQCVPTRRMLVHTSTTVVSTLSSHPTSGSPRVHMPRASPPTIISVASCTTAGPAS